MIERQSYFPRSIFEGVEKQPDGSYVLRLDPKKADWGNAFALVDIVSPRWLQSEVATFPNIPIKTVQRAVEAGIIRHGKTIPAYMHSCPTLDEQLFDHFPRTFYFDVGRSGLAHTSRRTLGYIEHTQERLSQNPPADYRPWMQEFGIGACIPFATRNKLFRWASQNFASLYAVPATSVAEAVTQMVRRFPELHEEFSELVKTDHWLHNGNPTREKGTSKLAQSLLNTLEPQLRARLLKGTSGKNLSWFIDMVKQMAHKQYFLGDSRNKHFDIAHWYAAWTDRVYNPRNEQTHPNFGNTADTSEIIVQSRVALSPIPWDGLVLFGDPYGTTTDQLLRMAKLMTQTNPEAIVCLLLGPDNQPYQLQNEQDQTLLMAAITQIAFYRLAPRLRNEWLETILPFLNGLSTEARQQICPFKLGE